MVGVRWCELENIRKKLIGNVISGFLLLGPFDNLSKFLRVYHPSMTRIHLKVFHLLGFPTDSISKNVFPGCLFSRIHVPSILCFLIRISIAGSSLRSLIPISLK